MGFFKESDKEKLARLQRELAITRYVLQKIADHFADGSDEAYAASYLFDADVSLQTAIKQALAGESIGEEGGFHGKA